MRVYPPHCVFPLFVSNKVLDSEVWCLLLEEWVAFGFSIDRWSDRQTDI